MFTRSKRSFLETKPKFIVKECRPDDPECECGEQFPRRRFEQGYDTCLACSTEKPKTANVAMHKQAYGYTTDPASLRHNPYAAHK